MRQAPSHPACLALLIATALGGCATPRAPSPSAAPPAPVAAARAAAGAETGEIAGAPFRIEVPADWNGDLVVYLHGYEPVGAPREGLVDQDDFDRWALAKGYGIARSSYSGQGWAVAEALGDTEAVRQRFAARFGAPRRSFLVGHSLGGHLVLATLERHPQHYAGALALCGVNAPAAEVFAEHVLPPLLAFEHFFPGVLGLAPGGFADPASPPWPDPAAIETALQGNEAKAALIAERFDIPREGLAGGLMIRHGALHELMQRAGGFPVDNRATVYTGLGDDAAFNAAVRRYEGQPAAIAYAAANAGLTGDARKPVVLLANDKDPTVPTVASSRYLSLAAAAGQGGNVVELPASGEGHCAFPPEPVDQAFEALVRWVDTGTRPTP